MLCLHYPQCKVDRSYSDFFNASKWHHFPFDATRLFFSFWAMTSSFLCSKMDSQPSVISPEDFSGDPSRKTSDGGLRCWDFKCKRKASWERGETKNCFSYSTSAPFSPPRSSAPHKHICWRRTDWKEQLRVLRVSLHCWWPYSAVESGEMSPRQRGPPTLNRLHVKHVNRNTNNYRHRHKAAV